MTSNTMKFEVPLASFDLTLLPANARTPGTRDFETAVREYFQNRFGLTGATTVTFASDSFSVQWQPAHGTGETEEEALRLLRAGRLREAIPLLEGITAVEPKNAVAAFNLGMALSDLGRLDDALKYLDRARTLEPGNANICTAVGVALQRSGDPSRASEVLREAVRLDPENGYAHRNLAALVGQDGDLAAAEAHLRKAVEFLPNDAASLHGLADVLLRIDAAANGSEADALLVRAIDAAGDSSVAELAREARSRLAHEGFRAKSVGSLRPDALMYCLGALERFETMSPQEVEGVFFEIAMLGMRGLDVNDPAQKYRLKSLPGSFSGLHLVSLMYVSGAQVHPDMDVGFDLRAEYEAAKEMHGVSKKKGD